MLERQALCSAGCCKRSGDLYFIGMAKIVAQPKAHTLLAQTIGSALREPLVALAKVMGEAAKDLDKGEALDFNAMRKSLGLHIARVFALPPDLLAPDHTEVPKVRHNRELPTYDGADDWGIGESLA